MEKKKITVYPDSEIGKHSKLFSSIEDAYPVSFHDSDFENPDMLLLFHYDEEVIYSDIAFGKNVFVIDNRRKIDLETNESKIEFSDSIYINSILKNRKFYEKEVQIDSILPYREGDEILANTKDFPIWIKRKTNRSALDIVSLELPELKNDEEIWNKIHNYSFISYLPFVHFVMQNTIDINWKKPPLRATIIIDDPNLHNLNYGFLKYDDLVEHIKKYKYHVCLATVPLDMFYVNKSVVSLFRENQKYISLMMHGVLHLKKELDRSSDLSEIIRYLSLGLNKTLMLEKEKNISISKTMIPPHGVVSYEVIEAMLRLGFEAVFINNQEFVWSELKRLPGFSVEFLPSYLIKEGFPIIQRSRINDFLNKGKSHVFQDQILRAFLGQPIVLYSHVEDYSKGLGINQTAVEQINSIGDIQWMSPEEISKTNYFYRIEDSVLHIRLLSRKIFLKIPENVLTIAIDYPENNLRNEIVYINNKRISTNNIHSHYVEFPVENAENAEIKLIRKNKIDSFKVKSIRIPMYSIVRRIICELRDRLMVRQTY